MVHDVNVAMAIFLKGNFLLPAGAPTSRIGLLAAHPLHCTPAQEQLPRIASQSWGPARIDDHLTDSNPADLDVVSQQSMQACGVTRYASMYPF